MAEHEAADAGQGDIAQFIEEHGPVIMDEWERLVRLQPHARDLSRPVLLDHMPELLVSIGEAAERISHAELNDRHEEAAMVHAIQRLEVGFDLDQVASELMLLRNCILKYWGWEGQKQEQYRGMSELNQAIDHEVMASIRYYTEARNRTLLALDRISAAALESGSLIDFLERLQQLTLETMPAVDAMAVLLLENGALAVCSSTGLEGGMDVYGLSLDEGFLGDIVKQNQPVLLTDDGLGSGFWGKVKHRENLQAVYGFPLVHGERLVGVVMVASRSAAEFSEQDKLLFLTLSSRATAAIVQHMLRYAAERRSKQQAAVAELSTFGLLSGEPQEVKLRALELIQEKLETDAVAIEQLDAEGRLVNVLYRGEWPLPSPRPVMPGSQAEAALGSQQAVIIMDFQAELQFIFPDALTEHGMRSGITSLIQAPDEITGRPYGLISAYSRRQRKFSPEDALFLQAIGSIVAGAVIRRRATEELAIGANRLQAILDNSPAAIYLKDLQGRYTLVNPSYERLTGLSPEDVIDNLDAELFSADEAQALHQIDRQAVSHRQPVEVEELINLHGELHTWHTIKFPLLDAHGKPYAICGISTDVTSRRRSEEELRESEERLQLATAVADLGTFDWDLITGKVGWSQKIREIFCLPDEFELTQDSWGRLIHPDDRQRVLRAFQSAHLPESDGIYRAEYRIHPADGSSERWVSAHGRVLFDGKGRAHRFIGIARDITDSKLADLERERLMRELEQAVRFREDLLAIVSHDLRNPLGAIKLGSALLARKELSGDGDERVLKQLDIIQRASGRMEHLISSLLDMASIRAGRLSVELSPCEAASLVDEALEFHAAAAAEKAISINQQVQPTDMKILCDHHRIQQVFSNLIGNAISYCGRGDSIRVSAELVERFVKFTVADNGPGMDPDMLAHIFEPFWSEPKKGSSGTGLGLFITKGIVEAHGGRIWAESVVGEGSCFCFTVPVAAA